MFFGVTPLSDTQSLVTLSGVLSGSKRVPPAENLEVKHPSKVLTTTHALVHWVCWDSDCCGTFCKAPRQDWKPTKRPKVWKMSCRQWFLVPWLWCSTQTLRATKLDVVW